MGLSLYEINKQIAEFRYDIDEETGEILNFDELEALNITRDEKIESLLLYVKSLRAEVSAIKSEEKSLEERRKAKENLADRIEEYAAANLHGKPFETARIRVSWRKSSSVEILNADAVPERFLDIQIVRKPMKSEIKKYLDNTDEEVPWARINEKNNIQIK